MEDNDNHDKLNFNNDKLIKAIIRDEIFILSDKIEKKNHYGFYQKRNIILTNKALYNLKKKQLKRRIDLKTIAGITFSSISDQFIIHCNDDEYDYHFYSKDKRNIIEAIIKYYYNETNSEIKLYELNEKDLSGYVTTKKEKMKNSNISYMPKTGYITVSSYLYGKAKIQNINNKESKIIKTGKIFCNSNINDFNFLKNIGRGAYGNIFLVELKKTKDLYVIKSIRKDQIISENILENIKNEKDILKQANNEFILNLSFFFQTNERIYFVTPFIKGGDLYELLKKKKFLDEETVKFYCVQIAIALQCLHDFGYIYRDLKPENILIDEDGYLKLCDFGSTIHIQGKNLEYSYAGTERYVSPEMINGEGYNMLTDWWSFGILIFELLYGFTPFYNENKIKMKQLITLSKIKFPKSYKDENGKEILYKVSNEAKNIIIKFLNRDYNERLGSGNKGFENIKKDNFFGGMDFKELEEKKIKSPYIPEIDSNELKNKNKNNLNESKVEDWINDYKNEFDIFNDEYNNEEYNN